MSSTVKVIRASGKVSNMLDVCGCEYQPVGDNVEMEISISGGD